MSKKSFVSIRELIACMCIDYICDAIDAGDLKMANYWWKEFLNLFEKKQ